jgi:hypothetical protein
MASIHERLERRFAAGPARVEPGPLQFISPGSRAPVIVGTGSTRETPRSVRDVTLIVGDRTAGTAGAACRS